MIQYRIYQNDGLGGPVDYSTVIATVAVLTWNTPPLPLSSDTTFAVRAVDTISGLEEQNVDARVRIRLDASGVDISALPNPPIHLGARATASGGAVISWQYNAGGQGGKPIGFRVYLNDGAGGAVAYGTVIATVPYSTGRPTFFATLSGLAPGDYVVGVRAYNATGAESNTVVATFTASGAGPDPVEDLTATAI